MIDYAKNGDGYDIFKNNKRGRFPFENPKNFYKEGPLSFRLLKVAADISFEDKKEADLLAHIAKNELNVSFLKFLGTAGTVVAAFAIYKFINH